MSPQEKTGTRERLLLAAGEVFAERGFRDATIAEICERAGANIAAVNYHFRDKANLYTEVWRHALEDGLRRHPIDGGLSSDATPEQRVEAWVHATMRRIFDVGKIGHATRMRLMEMARPTGLLDRFHEEVIKPLHSRTEGIVADALGPGFSEEQIRLCTMSMINQCFALDLMREFRCHLLGVEHPTDEMIERISDHITLFTLAGIRAMREQRKGEAQ